MVSSTAGTEGNVKIDDVAVAEVWKRLSNDRSAVLVDVRTKAEWSFVGVPDLSSIGKKVLLSEWQNFPAGQVDPQFSEKLAAQLDAAGVGKEQEIFFICRSGGRSKS